MDSTTSCIDKIILFYKKIDRWSFTHFYPDSRWKIYAMVASDIGTISIQIWNMFVYAGLQAVSEVFGEYALGVHAWYVLSIHIFSNPN